MKEKALKGIDQQRVSALMAANNALGNNALRFWIVRAKKEVTYAPGDGMDIFDEDTGYCDGEDDLDSYDDWSEDDYAYGKYEDAEGTVLVALTGSAKPKMERFNFKSGMVVLDDEGESGDRRALEKAWGHAVRDSGPIPTGNEGTRREFWFKSYFFFAAKKGAKLLDASKSRY